MTEEVLVSCATGTVASFVIPALLGAGFKVRALVRNAGRAKHLAEQGVSIFECDLGLPRSFKGAFEGIQRAMIIVPPGPQAPQMASSALWAARSAGVRHVIRLSAFGASHDAPTVNSRMHALSDEEIRNSAIGFTILKPNFFMQNLLGASKSITESEAIYLPLAQGRIGMIDVADIGAIAAHLLCTSGHEGKTYTLTGPSSISMQDVAANFSNVFKRRVQYHPVSMEFADQYMAASGLDEFTRTVMCDYFHAYSRDWGAVVTNDLPLLLGRSARSIQEFAWTIAPRFVSKPSTI